MKYLSIKKRQIQKSSYPELLAYAAEAGHSELFIGLMNKSLDFREVSARLNLHSEYDEYTKGLSKLTKTRSWRRWSYIVILNCSF